MRCQLFVPRYTQKVGEYYDFPLGMAYVAAALKLDGHVVDVVNLNAWESTPEASVVRDAMERFRPDAVLTGGLSAYLDSMRSILSTAKMASPEVVTVLGGGLVTAEPLLMLETLRPDFSVLGEGEDTVRELFQALAGTRTPESVAGLAWLRDGTSVRTPEREAIADLDRLPWPDYAGFDMEDYFARQFPTARHMFYIEDKPRAMPIITSRSCPLKCTFCFHPLGQTYRTRSLDAVFAEIEWLVEHYRINTLLVLDEMMSASKKRLRVFAERMRPYGLHWSCQISPRVVEPDLLRLLRESGCFYLSYGLESASTIVLKSMRKQMSVPQLAEGLALTYQAGIGIQGNFIFGDPAETRETAEETLRFWRTHPEYHINLCALLPYPGSPDYYHAIEKGIIANRLDYIERGCPVVNLTTLSEAEFRGLLDEIAVLTRQYRQYADVISAEPLPLHPLAGVRLYRMRIRCPHCGVETDYSGMHYAGEGPFKFACRACHQRYDLSPLDFPHIRQTATDLRHHLGARVAAGGSLAFTPAWPVDRLIEFLQAIDRHWETWPIRGILDQDPGATTRPSLNGFPLLPRNAATLAGLDGTTLVVLPSAHRQAIVNELGRFGWPDERLLEITEVLA
ncbi:anaerobic magnesium-protoporphyrin IX monomethyl ester cyclase [Gammaproteobacteria bacterium]